MKVTHDVGPPRANGTRPDSVLRCVTLSHTQHARRGFSNECPGSITILGTWDSYHPSKADRDLGGIHGAGYLHRVIAKMSKPQTLPIPTMKDSISYPCCDRWRWIRSDSERRNEKWNEDTAIVKTWTRPSLTANITCSPESERPHTRPWLAKTIPPAWDRAYDDSDIERNSHGSEKSSGELCSQLCTFPPADDIAQSFAAMARDIQRRNAQSVLSRGDFIDYEAQQMSRRCTFCLCSTWCCPSTGSTLPSNAIVVFVGVRSCRC